MTAVESVALTDVEFGEWQRWLHATAGIHMSEAKKALVASRLAKRLRMHGLGSYGEYFSLLRSGRAPDELQTAVDLLTTNETYFFREPKHFDYLRNHILPIHGRGETFRVWSAASSSGEEAYSIAMLLEDRLRGSSWEILGSDLSTRVLRQAAVGHYPMERAQHIPQDYLTRFCRRGVGSQEGSFLVDKSLRERVRFMHLNLNEPLPDIGTFHVVFLRNVMIYFDTATKNDVIGRLEQTIQAGGYLFIGHSENLSGVRHSLTAVQPAIFRKAA